MPAEANQNLALLTCGELSRATGNVLRIDNGLTVENRWGEPADVGRAVAMLARGELSYATGNVLRVDGGLTLRRL